MTHSRMDIIGLNGNDGLHYEPEDKDESFDTEEEECLDFND